MEKIQNENSLFGRKEILLSVNEKSTPSYADAEKLVADKLSTNAENIKVKKIESRFGSNEFIISAFVYDSPEEKDKVEPKPKQKAK